MWLDLCKNENNLLKAIQWALDYYKATSNIQDITI